MVTVLWPNIDIIVETLLVAILIDCEVSIHCVIKCQTTMATFPLRYQLDLNMVRGVATVRISLSYLANRAGSVTATT